jgi:hypothetical protein
MLSGLSTALLWKFGLQEWLLGAFHDGDSLHAAISSMDAVIPAVIASFAAMAISTKTRGE